MLLFLLVYLKWKLHEAICKGVCERREKNKIVHSKTLKREKIKLPIFVVLYYAICHTSWYDIGIHFKYYTLFLNHFLYLKLIQPASNIQN